MRGKCVRRGGVNVRESGTHSYKRVERHSHFSTSVRCSRIATPDKKKPEKNYAALSGVANSGQRKIGIFFPRFAILNKEK